MEALRKVAKAYYNSGTDEERRLFKEFFRSIDKDGSGRVSYEEFFDVMSPGAHDKNMCHRDFFSQLGKNRKGLDSDEVLTLYYILKSGRPICGRCSSFITNEYFTCMRCFEPEKAAYSICLECFGGEGRLNHKHDRLHFVDNFSLLESFRKQPLPHHQPSSRSSTSQGIASESSSNRAVVPHNSNTPSVGRPSSRSSTSQGTAQRPRSHSESPSNRAIVPHNSNTPSVGRPSSRSSTSQGTAPRRRSHSESPSNRAIVRHNSNTPTVIRAALLAFEAGLQLAGIFAGCSIM